LATDQSAELGDDQAIDEGNNMRALRDPSTPLFLFAVYSFTTLAGPSATCSADDSPFTHPGILHSRAELDFVQAKVAEGEEPWKSAWEELCNHDISELDWKPKPIADVVRGVRNHPDIGGTNLMRDGAAAYSHAIQWYVTGRQPHADKVIEILNAYADTLKSIGGHEGRYYYPKISSKSRGRFGSIYERVYHHYQDRMGMEMPFTSQVIEKIRPERWQSPHASWGTLMHAGQPTD
jgi:hypothetical protein